ncbi:MAG TPA: 50S ribosomal protein L11 methyltransferase [Panacibacter sp.]|nr:50S ribosomal protein L11 methyltransferase [Panacibacter sp.]
MNSNYIEIKIENVSAEISEILVAQLSEIGFDGFEESENSLSAFIAEAGFKKAEVNEIIAAHQLTFIANTIVQKNWNEEWEKNFDPVIVDDFVTIRAHFHEQAKGVEHEIIITPKMSFGTGHHATTYMMMQHMRKLDFKNKTVFDFGTGTGVLAILAEKLGAVYILAIDNDEWSINNAQENIERNGCENIELQLCNTPELSRQFNLILANINKNVILEHFKILAESISANGHLLVSGLLQEDEADILLIASALQLKHMVTFGREKWISMYFVN